MASKVVVGSKSHIKIGAVRRACRELGIDAEVIGIATDSGVRGQPMGGEETLLGARNRACAVHSAHPGAVAVGIENGVGLGARKGAYVWSDFAMIVVIVKGITFTDRSESVTFPSEDLDEALRRNVTVGQVIAERTGCDPADPHAFLTGGRLDRETLLVEPLKRLLAKALKESS